MNKNSISLDLNNIISNEKKPTLISKKLFNDIEECKNPIKSINKITDLYIQLSKEIDLFTPGGQNLQAAYSYLGTILQASVD